MKRALLFAALLMLIPCLTQAAKVCPAGEAVVSSEGPPNGCAAVGGGGVITSPALSAYTGSVGIIGNRTDGTDQLNKLCVNGVCPVTAFGAVGDCTPTGSTVSCTNNHDAIQSAINSAKILGSAVFLPSRVSGSAPTVYYTATAINPKGVSIYGPEGVGARNPTYGLSNIRGAASNDIFATGDPANGGFVTPGSSFTIKNLGLIVDDSVDASASFPDRKPGRTCTDVLATNGSAVVTSAAGCEFSPGDVGQNVTVNDGTNTLSTTILSITGTTGVAASTATLATNWTFTTTPATSTMYISLMGFATNKTIGNCAFTYDSKSGASAVVIANATKFDHVIVGTTSGVNQNNACAILFQGNSIPYNTVFDHSQIRSQFGLMFLNADVAPSSASANGLGDFITVRNTEIDSNYSWISYNGDNIHWQDVQISTAWHGPQILKAYSTLEKYPAEWLIDNNEFESTSGAPTNGGWRVDGLDHTITDASLTTAVATPARWDVDSSFFRGFITSGTLNMTGKLNTIEIIDGGNATTVTDTGFGNKCGKARSSNPLHGIQAPRFISCSATNSRQQNVLTATPDFISSGNESLPFNNMTDIWIWPPDAYGGGAVNPTVVADATSESGSYFISPSSGGIAISNIDGITLAIGTHIPATKAHICIRMKAASGTPSQTIHIQGNGSDVGTMAPTLNTTYSTTCTDVDYTGLTGDSASFNFNAAASNVYVAWISVRPWHGDLRTTPTTFAGAGTCATVNQGEQYFITDDNAACTFATIATGSGTTPCRIGCDGTNWRAGY